MAGKKGQKINIQTSKKYHYIWQKLYPEWTEEQCKEKAKWYCRSLNYNCIEYYEAKYPELSHEEHLKLKEDLLIQRRKNSKTNIEYWKTRYPDKSLEELEESRSKVAKERNKCNIEYWINKYPDKDLEEIKKLHNEYYQSWLSHQEGWGKGEKNPNHKMNSSQEERNARSPRNIAFYEKKYPELSHEEHLKMYNEFFEKDRLILKNKIKNTNIKYYLNQGMSEEEAKKALKDRQTTFSLDKCIKKYGEIEGIRIFKERQQKWINSLANSFDHTYGTKSNISNEMISTICEKLSIEVPNYEEVLIDIKNHKSYSYDFCYNNKIIEFNGDYWHCNPKFYKSTYYNKTKNKTAKEIWRYDNKKIKLAKKLGFDVLVIWEYDYNNDRENTIKKCINFLNT